jgi:hypothetical protein
MLTDKQKADVKHGLENGMNGDLEARPMWEVIAVLLTGRLTGMSYNYHATIVLSNDTYIHVGRGLRDAIIALADNSDRCLLDNQTNISHNDQAVLSEAQKQYDSITDPYWYSSTSSYSLMADWFRRFAGPVLALANKKNVSKNKIKQTGVEVVKSTSIVITDDMVVRACKMYDRPIFYNIPINKNRMRAVLDAAINGSELEL